MRQLKRAHYARFSPANTLFLAAMRRAHFIPEPGVVLFAEEPVAEVEKVWKVARMKDNVVVLEAKSAEEAQELIDKHARQKKAKLFLLDAEPFLYETA
jgi:hypothetical protein